MNKYIMCAVLSVSLLSLRGMEKEQHDTSESNSSQDEKYRSIYTFIKSEGKDFTVSYREYLEKIEVSLPEDIQVGDFDYFLAQLSYCILDEPTRFKIEETTNFDELWELVEESMSPKWRDFRNGINKQLRNNRNEVITRLKDYEDKRKLFKALACFDKNSLDRIALFNEEQRVIRLDQTNKGKKIRKSKRHKKEKKGGKMPSGKDEV